MKRYIKSSDDRLSKYTIEPIPECDDPETGEHTCWAMRSAGPTYTPNGERYDYIWITKYGDQEYVVENADGYNLVGEGKSYKTLRGATKQAAEIMWRRDESGSYQDVE